MEPLWTEADILALKTAVASGVLTVSYAGPPARTITYHSLESMRSLLSEMVRTVHQPRTSRRVQFSRGFGGPGRTSWRRNE